MRTFPTAIAFAMAAGLSLGAAPALAQHNHGYNGAGTMGLNADQHGQATAALHGGGRANARAHGGHAYGPGGNRYGGWAHSNRGMHGQPHRGWSNNGMRGPDNMGYRSGMRDGRPAGGPHR